MSNVSIYEKNWTDLVFEHKNKEYGAYQLRNENPRTTMLAFFVGLLFILSLLGFWMLLSSFEKIPEDGIIEIPDDQIILVDLSPIKPQAEPFKPKTEQTQSQSPKEPNNLSNMVVAATPDAQDDVPKNDDFKDLTPIVDTGSNTGTDIATPSSGSSSGTVLVPTVDSNKTRTTIELDRLPEYPGGIKKFYEYVGNSIERTKFDDNYGSISVIMGFVIEKDGSMSDIKVLRGSDKNLEKEAIRVLKSLRVKWSPGILDGDKVRTQYTLPIKVAL